MQEEPKTPQKHLSPFRLVVELYCVTAYNSFPLIYHSGKYSPERNAAEKDINAHQAFPAKSNNGTTHSGPP